MIRLTSVQMKHYETVMWYLAGGRGSGRTTLLAYCLLQCANQEPGRKFSIIEFPDNNHRDKRFMMGKIIEIAKEEGVPIEINISMMEFSVKNSNNYLPEAGKL